MRQRLQRAYRVLTDREHGAIPWFHAQLTEHGYMCALSSVYRWVGGEREVPEQVEGILRIVEADAILRLEELKAELMR